MLMVDDILHEMRLNELLTDNIPTHGNCTYYLYFKYTYILIMIGSTYLPTKLTEFILFRIEL